MKIPEFLRKRFVLLFQNDVGDPIDEEKNMVSYIQILVGIHNVFGDNDRRRYPISI